MPSYTHTLWHTCAQQHKIKLNKNSSKERGKSSTIFLLISKAFYLCTYKYVSSTSKTNFGGKKFILFKDGHKLIVGLVFLGGTKINLKDFFLFKGHLQTNLPISLYVVCFLGNIMNRSPSSRNIRTCGIEINLPRDKAQSLIEQHRNNFKVATK